MPVLEDTLGNYLDESVLVYRVYAGRSGKDEWTLRGETVESSFYLEDMSFSGCYDLYITAVRRDADIESSPSEIVEVCYPDTVDLGNTQAPMPPVHLEVIWE